MVEVILQYLILQLNNNFKNYNVAIHYYLKPWILFIWLTRSTFSFFRSSNEISV